MLGVRLDAQTELALTVLARRTRRSKSEIAREAIRRHVERHDEALAAEAQRQSLHAAAPADDGDFAFWEAIEAADGSWS